MLANPPGGAQTDPERGKTCVRRWTLLKLVRPEGLEPPAYWFEANRSIQLSYGRTCLILSSLISSATPDRSILPDLRLRGIRTIPKSSAQYLAT